MPDFDHTSALWRHSRQENYFRDLRLTHRRQIGGTCVSTGLSLLTGQEPPTIRDQINTQDPVSWSDYLVGHGMKLAYCSTDLRRLKFFLPEMLAIDDLFAIGIYSPDDLEHIGRDPDQSGWICGSHFVLLHRDAIYDTASETGPIPATDYDRQECFVKRIFRVVPTGHPRGL